jgi:hypothetical protein
MDGRRPVVRHQPMYNRIPNVGRRVIHECQDWINCARTRPALDRQRPIR